MKRNEIIELNGVEYTLELNRESALKIEQYADLQKSMTLVQQSLIEHIEEIRDDEDPFAESINIDELEAKAEEQLNVIKRLITRAFWIWLYPENKFNIKKVEEILTPYFDDENKIQYLSSKCGEYLRISTEISEKYIEEQKNLKAQVNK